MNKKLKVLGCCAGNGVILYPFLKDHEVIGNIEPRAVFHSKYEEQWRLNFGQIAMLKDIPIEFEKPDIIVGHPDCGSGSVLRLSRAKKRVEYQTNHSLGLYFKAIDHFKPKLFLLENLPAFGKEFDKVKLRELFPRYRFVYLEGSVAHFGNSQISRKRLIIIGIRKSLPKEILKLFKLPKIDKTQLKTAEKFEIDGPWELDDICHIREPLSKTCNLILGDEKIITYRQASLEWQKRVGQARWHVGGKMNNQPGVTRNIKGKYPTTMRKQNRQFTTEGLVLSPREMANIQGIPYEFKLYWSQNENKRIYDINKARVTVTKCAPYEVGVYFLKKLNKIIKRYGNKEMLSI